MKGRYHLLSLFILSMVLMVPGGDIVTGSYLGQTVFDVQEDITLYNVKERKVGGHPELDIVSLETFDRGTWVDAYLTIVDDISETFGYIYTMSIGGVEVIFDNGTFMVSSQREDDLLDFVEVEVNGQQLHAEVPKLRMDEGDFIINGSASEYILDHTSEITLENYYDSVSGETTNPLAKYQVEATDDRNDVRFSYLDISIRDSPSLDMISMTVERKSAQYALIMEFADPPVNSQFLSYEFGIGSDRFLLTGEEVTTLVGERRPSGHLYDGNTVAIYYSGEAPSPGEVLSGKAREELEGGSWLEDSCPDNNAKQLDIFPCDLGSRFTFAFEFMTLGEGSLMVSTSDLTSDQEWALLKGIDADSDGNVETGEIEGAVAPIKAEILYLPLASVDGSNGITDLDFVMDGIDEDEISLGWECEFDTGLDSGNEVVFSIPPFRHGDLIDPEEEMVLEMYIKVPEGYRIVPGSLEPDGLANHLDQDPNELIVSSSDPADLDLFTTGVNFRIEKIEESNPADDPVAYEDAPTWFFVLAILLVVGIMIWMYIRARKKREEPPEDF